MDVLSMRIKYRIISIMNDKEAVIDSLYDVFLYSKCDGGIFKEKL